jgi:glycosyltransferase involved in cell wall biosynthesis
MYNLGVTLLDVLHVSFSSAGGAGRVAKTLFEEQKQSHNYKSSFLYKTESALINNAIKNSRLTTNAIFDKYFVKLPSFPSLFSLYRNILNTNFENRILDHKGIIHLHWVNGILNFNSLNNRFFNKPIVWTLHDMEPFTGGCHFSFNCNHFESGCANCPAARSVFQSKIRKAKSEKDLFIKNASNLRIVVPSKWMKNRFLRNPFSFGREVEVIPNPINRIFFSNDRNSDLRLDLNIASDDFVIGFVCNDLKNPTKRFDTALEIVRETQKQVDQNIVLLTVGSSFFMRNVSENFRILHLGIISSEAYLKRCFSTMNINLSTSIAESFGLTIVESAALGVPSAALINSASAELIKDGETGFIAANKQDLVNKIISLISNNAKQLNFHHNCKKHAKAQWDIDAIIQMYNDLYERY